MKNTRNWNACFGNASLGEVKKWARPLFWRFQPLQYADTAVIAFPWLGATAAVELCIRGGLLMARLYRGKWRNLGCWKKRKAEELIVNKMFHFP